MSAFSDLLAAAKRGDAKARATLYERYRGPVLAAVRRRLSQPLRKRFDSLDVVHSVFAEVFRDLPRFRDLGEDSFRHWLYRKVEGNYISKLRKHLGRHGQRRERPIESGAAIANTTVTPASHAARVEEEATLRDLVQSLSTEQRKLFRMRMEQELPFAVIAERLGLRSAEAARKRYARCLAKLRRLSHPETESDADPDYERQA